MQDPIFLVYDSRSGSTLLANLIAHHFGLLVPPEVRFVVPLLRYFQQSESIVKGEINALLAQDEKLKDWRLTDQPIVYTNRGLSARQCVLDVCKQYAEQRRKNADYVLLKKGTYLFERRLLLECFPNSKFISIIRDGRAEFSSKKMSRHSDTHLPFETNPISAAETWKRYCQEVCQAVSEFPARFLTIRYEDLIADHSREMQRIARFLEREQCEKEPQEIEIAPRYSHLHKNVGQPPISARKGAWRKELDDWEIEAFESVARVTLVENGYETIYSRPRFFAMARLQRRYEIAAQSFAKRLRKGLS